ncbi:MAG TPA: hypothetical protein VMT19_02710 [Thermoanaerobaculaceae bacterium]|nr:hypothetical protein [Thermoanaerobaculaceae bacterium]
MRALRRLGTRTAGITLLVVLLLVPLALGAHGHPGHTDARPCAVCVVAHHVPAIVTPTVAMAAVLHSRIAPVVFGLAPEMRAARAAHSGRAPPRPSSALAA